MKHPHNKENNQAWGGCGGLKQGKKRIRELAEEASKGKEPHLLKGKDSDLLGNGVPWSLQQSCLVAVVDSFPYILQS